MLQAQALAQNVPAPVDTAEIVRQVLAVPDDELDYLEAKLAFDLFIDPEADATWVRNQVEALTSAARNLTKGDSRAAVRLGAVRRVLYEPGPWNGGRSFRYDMSDLLGRSIPNKLLHNYLRNRLGQCVSMPALFVILAERLGLKVSLCAAPEHVLVRYTDDERRVHNIEAANGGHPARDEWICTQFKITPRAIRSGIYLRTLSKREGIALLGLTIVEHLWENNRFKATAAVCKELLRHDPKDVAAMLWLASAYGRLLDQFRIDHPRPYLLRPEERAYGHGLAFQNARLFSIAESLGWQPFDEGA